MKKFLLVSVLAVVGLSAILFSQELARITTTWAANPACNIDNCQEQGGSRWSVGGSIDVLTGGDLDIESGGAFKIAGVDVTSEISAISGLTASVADLNATTNFEETISATTSEVTITAAKTLDVGAGNLQINNVAITATAVEINQAADESVNTEVVTATNVITAAESGATFFLNDATEFASTLPAVAAGLRYKFIVTGAPVGASYTVGTDSGNNVLVALFTAGGIDDASDSATAQDVVTFVDGAALVGDWIECICDGTSWLCRGSAAVAAGITTGAT